MVSIGILAEIADEFRSGGATSLFIGSMILPMPSEEDKEKAARLKREVIDLRAKRNDPNTTKGERARLKLQIDTKIWQGQRLDSEQFKTYRWRHS